VMRGIVGTISERKVFHFLCIRLTQLASTYSMSGFPAYSR
jgi:hypothetical protein